MLVICPLEIHDKCSDRPRLRDCGESLATECNLHDHRFVLKHLQACRLRSL